MSYPYDDKDYIKKLNKSLKRQADLLKGVSGYTQDIAKAQEVAIRSIDPRVDWIKGFNDSLEAMNSRMELLEPKILTGLQSTLGVMKIYEPAIALGAQEIFNALQPMFMKVNSIVGNPVFQDNARTIGQIARTWYSALHQVASSPEILQVSKTVAACQSALSTLSTNMYDIGSTYTHLNQRMEPILNIYPQFVKDHEEISSFFQKHPIQKPEEIPSEIVADTSVFLEGSFDVITQRLQGQLSAVSSENTELDDHAMFITWEDGSTVSIEDLFHFSMALTPEQPRTSVQIWHFLSQKLYEIATTGNDPAVTGLNNWLDFVRNLLWIGGSIVVIMKLKGL